jgi:hypothetical protein
MQLMQLPIIVGASYMAAIFLFAYMDGPQTAGVNPLSFARERLTQPLDGPPD